MTAACTRRSTPSFPSSREMWFFTVFSERWSRPAICRLVSPSPMRSSTDRSRSDRTDSRSSSTGPDGSGARRVRMSRALVAGSSIDWPVATVRTADTRSDPLICLST